MKDNFKRFLTFSKSERIAIITILTVVVMLLTAKCLLISNPPKRTAYFHNLDSIVESRQSQIDSLLRLDSIKKVERKAAYKKSKSSNTSWKSGEGSKKSFKEQRQKDTTHYQPFKGKTIPIVDINSSDTTLLKELPDIGSSFARRIVEYRGKLGGYVEKEQLLEVYGMDSTRFGKIENYVVVDSVFVPVRLRVNHDSFKVLNRHPYLDYEDVKKIVNHREQKGLIINWLQLKSIICDSVDARLERYVIFE